MTRRDQTSDAPNLVDVDNDHNGDGDTPYPDFAEGLSRLLSGILTHL